MQTEVGKDMIEDLIKGLLQVTQVPTPLLASVILTDALCYRVWCVQESHQFRVPVSEGLMATGGRIGGIRVPQGNDSSSDDPHANGLPVSQSMLALETESSFDSFT
jgi:hypothetical protein